MSRIIQLKKGPQANLSAASVALAELIYTTDTKRLYIGDGISKTLIADSVNVLGTFTDGSVSTPSITFENDTDTGIYRVSSNQIGFTVGGKLCTIMASSGVDLYYDEVKKLETTTEGVNIDGVLMVDDGTAALPSIRFYSDPDSGFYRLGENNLGFSIGGTKVMDFSGSGLIMASGTRINEFSTDGTMGGNADTVVPTEQAVKEYVDNTSSSNISGAAGAGIYASAGATLNVGAGDGIDVAADSVAVDVTDFIDTSYGLTENANDIRVNLDASGGLEFNAGAIRLEAAVAGDGLAHSSGVLSVNAGDGIDIIGDAVTVDVTDFIDTSYGLTENANDIRVNLDASGGLEFNSGAIRLEAAVAGNGLTHSSGVLSVNVSGGLHIAGDTLGLSSHGDAYHDNVYYHSGDTILAANGSAGSPSFSFASDTNTGIYRVGADELGLTTGGTQRFHIDASGNATITG